MTALAPLLEAWFTDRLTRQQAVSPHTIAAYRDSFRLLLRYVNDHTGKPPWKLDIADLDAPTIGAFLDHLQTARGNSISTRNARLAALRAFFSYAALCCPEHAGGIARVLAIPEKRGERTVVTFLTAAEADALLQSPDRSTWIGRRDHTLLAIALQTGLRVSEITGLRRKDVALGAGPHLWCHGKGRKDRCTPLTTTSVSLLKAWLREHHGTDEDPVFPSRQHGRHLSRDSVAHLVRKHAVAAQDRCPSLRGKTVTAHTLRHSSAMALLQAGTDIATISLWLGHAGLESTTPYIHADLALKEKALARTAPTDATPSRYHASDKLLEFLDAL